LLGALFVLGLDDLTRSIVHGGASSWHFVRSTRNARGLPASVEVARKRMGTCIALPPHPDGVQCSIET
jgi:hypothetical protein